MNIIRECYHQPISQIPLFSQYGLALFNLPVVKHPSSLWLQAMQHFHQAQICPEQVRLGMARVRGRRIVSIPGGTMTWVAATCTSHVSGHFGEALLELLDSTSSLPEGVLVSPAMVTVSHNTVYVPVVNVAETSVTLQPCQPVLMHAQIVSLPAGVSTALKDPVAVSATAFSQVCQVNPILEQREWTCRGSRTQSKQG